MNRNIARRSLLNGVALAEQPKIEYRTLGKTGLKLSSARFGCMITSDASVIDRSLDLGINYFDTATDYQGGDNERLLGAAVKSRRAKVYISTKTAALERQEAVEDLNQLEENMRAMSEPFGNVDGQLLASYIERYLRLAGDARLERCDCSSCSVKCAFGVNVAGRVRRAQQLLA